MASAPAITYRSARRGVGGFLALLLAIMAIGASAAVYLNIVTLTQRPSFVFQAIINFFIALWMGYTIVLGFARDPRFPVNARNVLIVQIVQHFVFFYSYFNLAGVAVSLAWIVYLQRSARVSATYGAGVRAGPAPSSIPATVLDWVQSKLFTGVANVVLTVLAVDLIAAAILPVIRWGLIDAIWRAPNGAACHGDGACWAFIGEKLRFILFGFFPVNETWRPIVVVAIFLLMVVAACNRRMLGRGHPIAHRTRMAIALVALPINCFIIAFIVDPAAVGRFTFFIDSFDFEQITRKIVTVTTVVIAAAGLGYLLAWLWGRWLITICLAGLTAIFLLMHGGFAGMSTVETAMWSGLPLTLILAVVGMLLGFPLGVLLALGRRSRLPAVRTICVGYIELVRGVPLITLLFMASLMLPLFLPAGVTVDKLIRAQVAFILFAGAYLAEVVRGGLQAIPRGQIEAADSLGLSYFQRTRLIVLPQALSMVIPPLVNTFIGIFKDTALVIIISLFDLLTTAETALSDPNWQGFYVEVYVFVGVIYWSFCFFMSRYSQSLEREFNRGTRR